MKRAQLMLSGFPVWAIAGLLLLCLLGDLRAAPLTRVKSVEALNIEQIKSLPGMAKLMDQLAASMAATLSGKTPNYELQQALLAAAGGVVSPLFELYQGADQSAGTRQQVEQLYLDNRQLINRALQHNQAVIRDYQENHLDQMDNPAEFFQSAAWQGPQKTISIGSYWLGWNGYYASLVMGPELEIRKTILQEAVTAFSRSFIDFKEQQITTKSLYGRGLVYLQQAVYGRAAYDFKSVKEKVGREDPLYLNCLYQEAVISHQLGNQQVALSLLAAIKGNYLQSDIPAGVRLGIKKLQAQLLVAAGDEPTSGATKLASASKSAASEKRGTKKTPAGRPSGRADVLKRFEKLKAVAHNDQELFAEFYDFSRDNADKLAELSFAVLTPVAALAVADWHFQRSEFVPAETLYRQLKAKNPRVVKAYADRVQLNLAYLDNRTGEYGQVVKGLKKFSSRYPQSPQLADAVALYYAAALAEYKESGSKADYRALIHATGDFVNNCKSCSGRDEAFFLLAQHHQKLGDMGPALKAYSRVSSHSSHYFVAAYYLASSHLSTVENGGPAVSKRQIKSAHKKLGKLLKQYVNGGKNSPAAASLQPNWALLIGRYQLFSQPPKFEQALAGLAGFEQDYPQAEDLLPQLLMVRAQANQKLNRPDQLVSQIAELAKIAASDKPAYQRLQTLADRFYRQLKLNRADGSALNLKQPNSALAAIQSYQHLIRLSQPGSGYGGYLLAMELRLGKLYRAVVSPEQAIGVYQQILTRAPQSADALFALAETHSEGQQWQSAIELWRRINAGLESGSDRWLQARYQTALALQGLERPDAACTITRMTQLLHPELGNLQLNDSFVAIEQSSCSDPVSTAQTSGSADN